MKKTTHENTLYFKGIAIDIKGKPRNANACFCIGPENCNDGACKLVKEYREKELKI